MAIDPELLFVKPINEIPVVPIEDIQTGNILAYTGTGDLKQVSANALLAQITSDIFGKATQSNSPDPDPSYKRYNVVEPITVASAWGIEVTQAELDANRVFFDVENGVVSVFMQPSANIADGSITPEKTKVSASSNMLLFGAGNINNTGGNNLALGKKSLSYSNTTGKENTAIGNFALQYSETNTENVAVGYFSNGNRLNAGNKNVSIGTLSMYNNEGTGNVGIGQGALYSNKGNENVSIGSGASANNINGTKNVHIGSGAGGGDYSYSISIGSNALTTKNYQAVIGSINIMETVLRGQIKHIDSTYESNVYYGDRGQYNYFLGGSGRADFTNGTTNFYGNTALGFEAMALMYDGLMCTAIGYKALSKTTIGIDHTAVGAGALENQMGGVGCTAMGRLAMAQSVNATNNTGIGDTALEYNVAGNSNTAVGYSSGIKSGGSNNTLMGVFAGGYITGKLKPTLSTYNKCNVFGAGAMQYNDVSDNNNLFGYMAGHRLIGADNSGFGNEVLNNGSDISRNTAFGAGSGYWLETGNDNVFIGYNSGRDGQVRTVSGTTVIGATAYSTRDNEIVIGKNTDTHVTIAGVEFTKAQLIALKALV